MTFNRCKDEHTGNWMCCDGCCLFYRASQHIDWLEDPSESWNSTLPKSAPLGEDCEGLLGPRQDKSHKTKTEIVDKSNFATRG